MQFSLRDVTVVAMKMRSALAWLAAAFAAGASAALLALWLVSPDWSLTHAPLPTSG
jgi:hypothetical protein